MSNGFGNDYFTISDEDGNDYELEHLDTIEIDGKLYMAFLPTDMDEDDEDFGFVILAVEDDDGEEILVSIDDEELLENLCERFVELFLDENDE